MTLNIIISAVGALFFIAALVGLAAVGAFGLRDRKTIARNSHVVGQQDRVGGRPEIPLTNTSPIEVIAYKAGYENPAEEHTEEAYRRQAEEYVKKLDQG